MATIKPGHLYTTDVVSDTFRIKFLLDPTSYTLGESKLTPEEIQLSGIDTAIRKIFHHKLQYRYKLLKKKGIIVSKKTKLSEEKKKKRNQKRMKQKGENKIPASDQ